MQAVVPIQPWYRNLWPWLLMVGPACAVLGGAATLWLALISDDGLVAEDYYKQGMAINRTLAREQLAQQLGYRARVDFTAAGQVRVELDSPRTRPLPPVLRLRMVHPTRAGADESVALRPAGVGVYEGNARLPAEGRRTVILEDAAQTWRLSAAVEPRAQRVQLLMR